MGVTITSLNKSIDLGYFGFNKLRSKIAELTNDEINEHYKLYDEIDYIFDETEKTIFLKKYNKELNKIDKKYDYKYNSVLYFLYFSDFEGKIDVNVCKSLYEVIKNYDDNVKYGYAGREDCATFKDFKELVKDCIDNNFSMSLS